MSLTVLVNQVGWTAADGQAHLLSKGDSVPDDAPAEQVKFWQAVGMVGAPGTKPDGQPGGNASWEVWATYARSQGATEDDLDGTTRDELRARYGS